MDEDKELKEAIEECAKVVEERCKKRPYMIIISKADVGYASEEDKEKGLLRGQTSFMYMAKPSLGKDGLSRLLVDSAKMALDRAERKIEEEESAE